MSSAESPLKLPSTYGVVACGGKSSRMQQDKSMLIYHGKPQRYHVYEMLLPLCDKVIISTNELNQPLTEADTLPDDIKYADIGPMAGLLTAFKNFPGNNILFIGCDYPFLSSTELCSFSQVCIDKPAAFYNPHEDLFEPLLAWYPYSSKPILEAMFDKEEYSLQYFLRHQHALKYLPANTDSIQSIDDPESYLKTKSMFNL